MDGSSWDNVNTLNETFNKEIDIFRQFNVKMLQAISLSEGLKDWNVLNVAFIGYKKYQKSSNPHNKYFYFYCKT